MAVAQFYQNDTIPFSVDVTEMINEIGALTAVVVEFSQNKTTIVKFREPIADGYSALTVNGNVYSGKILSASTAVMRGNYDIEITGITATDERKGSAPFMTILTQST